MASRFAGWYRTNKYPWESYEEARSRYELLYGPDKKPSKAPPKNEKLEVKDYEPIKSASSDRLKRFNESLGRKRVPKQEETGGFLDDTLSTVGSFVPEPLVDLYQGGRVGFDEAQSTIGSTTADIIGPAVKGLGFEDTGDDLIDWGRDYYKEQSAEARAEEASHGEKLTALEQLRKEKGDPTYTPRTKEEIMAQEPDSTEAKIYDYLPDWVPSWEEAKAYRPTAYEVGRTATASGVPMVAAAGAGAVGLAAGKPILGTLAAMGAGSTLSGLLVASEYGSETAKTNPVILKSLGLDPNVKFEDRPTTDQQKILKVGADSAQLTFGRRLVSSGVPEMLGYAPFGGVIFRTLLDMAGGTASEIMDLDVGQQATVDALVANGVPQDKAYGILESLREIGPKKQQVFTQALVSEGVLSGGFSAAEVALHGGVSHQVDESKTLSKRIKEEQEKTKEGVLKDRQKQASKKEELVEDVGEAVKRIVGLAELGDMDGAVETSQVLRKPNEQEYNKIMDLLMKERPDVYEQIGRRMGDKEMIDKINEQWSNLDEQEADLNAEIEENEIKKAQAAEKEREKQEKQDAIDAEKLRKKELKILADAEKKRKKKLADAEKERKKKEKQELANKAKETQILADLEKKDAEEKVEVEVEEEVQAEQKWDDDDVTVPAEYLFRNKDDKEYFTEEYPEGMTQLDYEEYLKERQQEKIDDASENSKLADMDVDMDFGDEISAKVQKDFENAFNRDQKKKKKEAKVTAPEVVEEVTTPEVKKKKGKPVKKEVGDANTFINEGMKAFKKKNKKASKEELDAENERLGREFFKNKKIEINPERAKFIADAVEKARKERRESATAGTTPIEARIAAREDYSGEATEKIQKVEVDRGTSDLTINEINKIEFNAGKEWDEKNGSTIKSRSRSTRSTKRGAFGMTVDEVRKAVNGFKNRNKKLKDVKFNTLSVDNKNDVNFLRKLFKTEAEVNDTLKNTEGFVDESDGQIYIISENIKGDIEVGEQGEQTLKTAPDRLVEVLFHETFGHHGLKKSLGNNFTTFINRFQKTNKRRLRKYFTQAEGRAYLPDQKGELKERQKNYDQLSEEQKGDLAEEYIARNFAEFGARDPNILHRMGVHLERAMNKMGWGRISRDQVMMTLAEIQQDYIGGERNFILGETFKPARVRPFHMETGDEAVVETAELTPEEQYEARKRSLTETKKKAEKAKAEPRKVNRTPEDMQKEFKDRLELFEEPRQAAVHNESTDELSLHTYVKNKIKNNRKVKGNKANPPKLEVVAQRIANAIDEKMPDRTKWKYGTESKPSEFDKVMEQAIADETIANSKKKPAKIKKSVKFADELAKAEGNITDMSSDRVVKTMSKAYEIDISDEAKLASRIDTVIKDAKIKMSRKFEKNLISHGQIIRDPLILDVSKIKGISKADIKKIVSGNGPFIFMWDRMRGDGFYETPSGVKIPLQGGASNSYLTYNMLAGIVGSSTSAGNVVKTLSDRVRESNGYGIVGLMGTDAHASNPTFHAIYTQVIRDLLGTKGAKRKALVQEFYNILNEKAKEGLNPKTADKDNPKGKPYGLPAVTKMIQDAVQGKTTASEGGRPPIKSDTRSNAVLKAIYEAKTPEAKYKIFEDRGKELTFDARSAILGKLGGVKRTKRLGIPSLNRMLEDTIDPAFGPKEGQSWASFRDGKTYNGDLVQVMKFDKNKPLSTAQAEGLAKEQAHFSYDVAFKGEPVGRFKNHIPLYEGTKNFFETFRTAEGKKVQPPKYLGTSIMVMPSDLKLGEKDFAPYAGKYQPVETESRVLTFEEKVTKPEDIMPTKLTSSAIKRSRRMVRRSVDFSMSRMGDPAMFEWQDKLAHKLTRRLVSQGTLNDVEMYKQLRRRNQGVMMLAEKAGERLFKILAKSKQQKELYDYFTTRNADPTVIKDKDERKAAIEAKKKINDIGKQLVKRGLMTQASLDKYGDQYLPRKYLKYLLSDNDFKKISAAGANTKLDLDYLNKRKDIPKGIRELILGEIKDPAFLASAAITSPMRDMAMLDWLEQIAIVGKQDGREWVLPSTLVKFDTVKMMRQLAGNDTELINQLQLFDTKDTLVSGHWLMNEADRIQQMVDKHMVLDTDKERIVRRLVAKMKEEGTKITGAIIPKNYVRVPKGRKYGKLSGMAVRKEIFQDIWGATGSSFDVDENGNITMSTAEKLLGTGGGFEQFNRFWKWSKVSANPPSWVRNFISNCVFMTLGPIPLHKIPILFASAINDQIRTRLAERKGETVDSMTTLADRMGLTSAGFSQVELKLLKNNFDKIKDKGQGAGTLLHIKNAFKGLQGKTSDLYGGIDTLGKVMMLTHLKKKGYSDDRAAMEAEKWLFDYSNPLPSVKYLRQTAFGAPFLSYPSFVAPLLIETIIKRPWKFAPYFILGEAMTALFKEQQDIDDEEWQATLETMPKHLRNKAVGGSVTDILFPKSVIPIWWPQMWGGSLDANKRAQPVDVGYLVPWGMFAEVARELDPFKEEGWQPADAMHSVGLLGAPLLNIATTILTNRDPFSDKEIYDEFATQGEKTASWFHYMWNLAMPPMLHGLNVSPFPDSNIAGPGKGYGAFRRLIDTWEGKVTVEGEPRFTFWQAVARMYGINITPIAPHEARAKDAFFEMQKIKRLQRRIAHNYERGIFNGMTEAQLKEQVQRDTDKLNNLVKKLKERLAKPLPQSLKRSKAEQLRVREKFLRDLRRRKAG